MSVNVAGLNNLVKKKRIAKPPKAETADLMDNVV